MSALSTALARPSSSESDAQPVAPHEHIKLPHLNLARRIVRVEDMDFICQVFGREREFSAEQAGRVGREMSDVVREFVNAPEFTAVVQNRMNTAERVAGAAFEKTSTEALRHWIAACLPLSPEGCSRAIEAGSWHELYTAIFTDSVFSRDVVNLSAPATELDEILRPRAQMQDVGFVYRIFLGRECESHDQIIRIGRAVSEIVREIVYSPEFAMGVQERLKTGMPGSGPVFDGPPAEELRRWVAARLPLSSEGCCRVLRTLTCYDLHMAILVDPVFGRAIVDPGSPLAELMAILGSVSLIDASLLFERDWYLETYRDVAASGGDPLLHYLMHGVAEGRNPNRLFDTRWYLSAYPQVKSERTNPLVHYVLRGAKSGYDPHPFFSTKNFLRDFPSAAESDLTALAEYLHNVMIADPASFPKFGPYDVYKATLDNYRRRERVERFRHIEIMTFTPTFIVLIDGRDESAAEATRESLARQIYRRVLIAPSVKDVLKTVESDKLGPVYFLWLDAGDELDPEALYELAAMLNADPSLKLIYFDHEVAADHGLSDPFHKPDWSPDYLESFNYIGSAACFELSKASELLLKADGRYDFILRYTESFSEISHIDQVLLRTQISGIARLSLEQEASDIRAIAGRLARTGRRGAVSANVPGARSYDLKIVLRSAPLVSAIIPTAGRVIDYDGKRIDLIVECLESILKKSSYKNLEFIIIDNGDFDRGRLRHIKTDKFNLLTYSLAEVNIAKKINLGASVAAGEIFLILNDDIMPLTADWIERMLAHLEKPHVGVVGAKLLYPNRTIQHAGIVACDGQPEHVRRGRPHDDIGFAFSTCGVRNYLAVTGAVSMVRAKDFYLVGGYGEDLPFDYNDVDFSYKLIAAGYSVVYEPRAELVHYESVSVVRPPRPGDAERFARKWASIANDPFYNEYCFSKHPPKFELAYSKPRH
jgi:GT2 family glycosyltransferase